MTIRILSGAYPGGYTLAAQYEGVSITHAGSVDRDASPAGKAGRSLHNPDGSRGAVGGVALDLPAGGGVANAGHIRGGAGGAGGAGFTPPGSTNLDFAGAGSGGDGGKGGVGLKLLVGGSIGNAGSIAGGAGGAGGHGGYGEAAGAAGAGGYGVVLAGAAPITNHEVIAGGAGGAGGYGGDRYLAGSTAGGQGGGGVLLASGGEVANYGRIDGGDGGDAPAPNGKLMAGADGGDGGVGLAVGPSGRVENFAKIEGGAGGQPSDVGAGQAGTQGDGIVFSGGGEVQNGDLRFRTALIAGGAVGVSMSNAGTVLNFATIQATGAASVGTGVFLADGGTAINGSAKDSTALIEGTTVGVSLGGPGAVTNFGTIAASDGASGVSVKLGSARDRLTAEAGSMFLGRVQGDGGSLELAGGVGTITGLGATAALAGAVTASVSGFAAYAIDSGAAWTLAGVNTLSAADTLTIAGSLSNTGTLAGAGVIVDTGSLANIATGVIDADAAGGMTVDAGGANLANAGLIEATTTAGLLSINGGTIVAGSAGSIAATGGRIVLNGCDLVGATVTTSGGGLITFSGAGNELDGSAQYVVTLAGAVAVADGAMLTLAGSVFNKGTLTLAGRSAPTGLLIAAGEVLLGGGGEVTTTDTGANRIVSVGPTPTTLFNLDNRILAAGTIGGAALTLVNGASGLIDAFGVAGLTIDAGANRILNSGTIEATGAGGLTIDGPLDNFGLISANHGAVTVIGAVFGDGAARINGATLDLRSAFSENVDFADGAGVLELADSTTYAGQIAGFSTAGATTLELDDILFADTPTWTYVGTATSGQLTVEDSDGHTARITLDGDYLATRFALSAGPNGGTAVTDSTTTMSDANLASSGSHAFIQAVAALGSSDGARSFVEVRSPPIAPQLTPPRLSIA